MREGLHPRRGRCQGQAHDVPLVAILELGVRGRRESGGGLATWPLKPQSQAAATDHFNKTR